MVLTTFPLTFAYISLSTTLILPFIYFVLKIRNPETSIKFFFSYFVIAAITEIILLWFHTKGNNNMPVINTFALLQFLLLSLALFLWLNSGRQKIFFLILIISIFIYGFIRLVFVTPLQKFDSTAITVENILLVLLSGSVLLMIAKDTSILLFRNPKFWFASAILLYFSVTIIVFCTGNFLMEDKTYIRKYTWIINSFLTILSNIFYTTGLLCFQKKKT